MALAVVVAVVVKRHKAICTTIVTSLQYMMILVDIFCTQCIVQHDDVLLVGSFVCPVVIIC